MASGQDRDPAAENLGAFIDQIAKQDYARLIERLPVIVYAAELGENGAWRYVSPQVEEILGFTPAELKRDPELWARALHPEDRRRALAAETIEDLGKREPNPVEYRVRTRDGRVVWLLDEAILEREPDGAPVWHGVLYDISARKRAEIELNRIHEESAVVAQLGERALKSDEPASLLEAAIEQIGAIDGFGGACVWEAGSDGRRLVLRAGLDAGPDDGRARPTAARDSHAGAALAEGAAILVADWSHEERYSMPPALRVVGAGSSLAVPIAGKGPAFGVLDVHAADPGRFGEGDVAFLRAAANILAEAFERHAADLALRHRVLHDALTGFPNRLSFLDSLDAALGRAGSSGSPVGILFLDLDRFKLVNDGFGHHAGDALLRDVGPRLRSHLRPGDIVARFGGDEFGILADRLADVDEAMAIADRVSSSFAQPFTIDGVDHFVDASIGVAVADPAAGPPEAESLIRDADAAMYRAKERGRGRSVLFDDAMRESARSRLEVELEIRGALERGEFDLNYQPIVNLRSGEVTEVEALARWRHPRSGLLEAAEFISIAEESGMIGSLGAVLMEQACEQALGWAELRPDDRPLDVAVNVSGRQVAHRDLARTVAAVLDRTGLDPVHLRLEITESALVIDSAAAISTLRELNELGVRLVLDDFGTGYSSLSYLGRFSFHALKIDRSFVRALGIEAEGTAIVEAMIGMARALSLDVVAEGVEHEAQLAELRRLGCDYVQGHLFSAALPAARIGELLAGGELAYSTTAPGR